MVDGTGSNFVRYQRWKVGVIAKYNSGRREDGESLLYIGNKSTKDLKGPGDVKGHAEFGGFLSRVELRQYMDVHEGMTGQAGFKFNGSARLFEQNIMYSIGPKITFADRDYINAYFSINQEQSIASGLNEYEYENKEQGFSSGLNISLLTYGFHGTLVVALKNSVSVAGFAGIDRITNDVAESPLIQSRGAENQAIAGLLVNYSL
ncbi:MAG: outer membrane protein [Gammaproteobacteria bacterium]